MAKKDKAKGEKPKKRKAKTKGGGRRFLAGLAKWTAVLSIWGGFFVTALRRLVRL